MKKSLKLFQVLSLANEITGALSIKNSPQNKYEIRKFANSILSKAEEIEKVRVELVQQYGQGREDGMYELNGENKVKFTSEFSEFLEKEEEFTFPDNFDVKLLGDEKTDLDFPILFSLA